MEIDTDKVDDAALALLSMTMDKYGSAWKQLDWDVMNSLYEKGYINNPVNKNKSVVLTEKGMAKAQGMFKQLFAKD